VYGAIDIPGPWRHRYVAANGCRFHVAEATPEPSTSSSTGADSGTSDPPLVLLLHGFPEFWWAWRHQLPALSRAGYRAVAMDLRGYGGSDKPPRGYDPMTLADDVAGVVKALGAREAVVVGQGWGGYVAWAAAVTHPREIRALCAVSAPHPCLMLKRLRRGDAGVALRHVLAMQLPMLPERRLSRPGSGLLARHLAAWSAPVSAFPDREAIDRYQAALRLWPAPHCALEYHRWLFRSRVRADGRTFERRMRHPVTQPVLTITGELDPVLPSGSLDPSPGRAGRPFRGGRGSGAGSARVDANPATARTMAGVGHFPHEERPEAFNDLLLDWLAGLG